MFSSIFAVPLVSLGISILLASAPSAGRKKKIRLGKECRDCSCRRQEAGVNQDDVQVSASKG
jgi:hypothetical protein